MYISGWKFRYRPKASLKRSRDFRLFLPDLTSSACPALAGYSELVGRIRANCKTMASVEEAVDGAIASCIADGILADYLSGERAKVASMFMTDWDQEEYGRIVYCSGVEDGIEQTVALFEACGVDPGIVAQAVEEVREKAAETVRGA